MSFLRLLRRLFKITTINYKFYKCMLVKYFTQTLFRPTNVGRNSVLPEDVIERRWEHNVMQGRASPDWLYALTNVVCFTHSVKSIHALSFRVCFLWRAWLIYEKGEGGNGCFERQKETKYGRVTLFVAVINGDWKNMNHDKREPKWNSGFVNAEGNVAGLFLKIGVARVNPH